MTSVLDRTELESKIIELWPVSRVGLANIGRVPDRMDRMRYVVNVLRKNHPDLIKDISNKKLWLLIEHLTSPTHEA